MALRLGDVVPDFRADSTHGAIALHDFIAGQWAILFSHPNDFTPVCTTELAAIARLLPDFTRRGVRLLALSCNDLLSHMAWIRDIESIAREPAIATAMASDSSDLKRKGSDSSDLQRRGSDSLVEGSDPTHIGSDSSDSTAFGSNSMAKGLDSSGSTALGSDSSDATAIGSNSMAKGLDSSGSAASGSDSMATKGLDSADSAAMGSDPMAKGSDSSDSIPTVWYPIVADPDRAISARLGILDPDELDPQGSSLAARSVLILGPDKKLKASILYPASTGRNFAEILRVIDSLQLTARYSVATPVDWSHGRPCMVLPTLSDASARDKLPKGFCTIPVPSGKPYLRLTPQPDL